MSENERTLDPATAQGYYDRFGEKQDSQGFYEDAALDELIAHSGFRDAGSVFEFGCGTGKFAARLLATSLPSSASYLGCDVSPVMIGLATRRLQAYGGRAQVVRSDGAVRFPLADRSVDRVLCCYVLDLLSAEDIVRFFSEAHRVTRPGGSVCIASLARGVNLPSRIVSFVWKALFRLRPVLVGGCRPIHVDAYVNPAQWRVVHRKVLTPFAVPSEVLVLQVSG